MWFKGLVSITCLAVIAVAGIYVWDRFYTPLNKRAEDCAYEREQMAAKSATAVTEMDRIVIRHCEEDGY